MYLSHYMEMLDLAVGTLKKSLLPVNCSWFTGEGDEQPKASDEVNQ
ncbi:hypothetical protein EYZ11_004562 [Aspergillus tanneri]|uniref:Uncharacterized protein n=1 Tax=Aspergillus tanneri TaxID=1220188 RepID=A0A4S3JKQ7_9EURO|nr:hypothetical protein EYZ11_004562 [Aspergillus tanneri]